MKVKYALGRVEVFTALIAPEENAILTGKQAENCILNSRNRKNERNKAMTLRKIGNNYYSYFQDEYGKSHTYAAKTTDLNEAKIFDQAIMETVRAKRRK